MKTCTSDGQSILSFPYFDSGRLSAGFQSNRILLASYDARQLNIQFQHSVLNEKFKYQLFNISFRYNLTWNHTRVTPSASWETDYTFNRGVLRPSVEIQQKAGLLTMGVMGGWNSRDNFFFYLAGLNANVTSRLSLQTSYGNYRSELFSDEKRWENAMIYRAGCIALKFYSEVPVTEGRPELKYNRFITSFLIIIPDKK